MWTNESGAYIRSMIDSSPCCIIHSHGAYMNLLWIIIYTFACGEEHG